ncbi:hypothetical protein [Streptomyces sp. NPDC048636]|uniref:hypothetical protein n=1 Tax=Streptomyces sp. NPDC048636 TaxID=3155762 RepID=UPI00343DB575
MRITLGKKARVKNWPYDLSEGNSERHFDGVGDWSYGVGTVVPSKDTFAYIDLSFDDEDSTTEGEAPLEEQTLDIGGTPEDPVLFVQDDPDSCPDAEFRR